MVEPDVPVIGGLFTGFESFRIPRGSDIRDGLTSGLISVDTNVLLNLYRYNDSTSDDIIDVLEAAKNRLFVPHQVAREFWRNRQAVIGSLGGASKEAQSALTKNETSTKDALTRWAKSVALPEDEATKLKNSTESFYAELKSKIKYEPTRISPQMPTDDDRLLGRLARTLEGRVGAVMNQVDWNAAVEEGNRRVKNLEPPGYMDAEKLESDLPEGAAGDYLVWCQLLSEGRRRKVALTLVTADVKEDWWNRTPLGRVVGPRQELVHEYLAATGQRLFLLTPADLLKHSTALGVGTSAESVEEIERIQTTSAERADWNRDAFDAVMGSLELQGYPQAPVIREAALNGGRINRTRVYEIAERDESFTLRGFTRPVTRITSELQDLGMIPAGLPSLLAAGYDSGAQTSHFTIPPEVVALVGDAHTLQRPEPRGEAAGDPNL